MEFFWYVVLMGILAVYIVLDGYDFGAGMAFAPVGASAQVTDAQVRRAPAWERNRRGIFRFEPGFAIVERQRCMAAREVGPAGLLEQREVFRTLGVVGRQQLDEVAPEARIHVRVRKRWIRQAALQAFETVGPDILVGGAVVQVDRHASPPVGAEVVGGFGVTAQRLRHVPGVAQCH